MTDGLPATGATPDEPDTPAHDRADEAPADETPADEAAPDEAASDEAAPDDEPIPPLSPATRRRLTRLAACLVIALLAGGAGYAIGGASRDGTVDDLDAQVGTLGDAADAAVRIAAEPDARQVALLPATTADRAAGEVVFAPKSGRLLVIATGLAPEPAGYTYRLLLGTIATRHELGAMAWAGGAWSWSGTVADLAGSVGPGGAFAVSLVSADGSDIGPAVLSTP
jgi:hypothetical protein